MKLTKTRVIPPAGLPLSDIGFANDADTLDTIAQAALRTDAWAVRRWHQPALMVPDLAGQEPDHPTFAQRRAGVVAAFLRGQGVDVVAGETADGNAAMRLQQGNPG